jgi:hypothetical protein
MTQESFDYWVAILKAYFPDHPALRRLGRDFFPRLPSQAVGRREVQGYTRPVLNMTVKDGARSADPDLSTAREWLQAMQPGESLTFNRRDRGALHIGFDGTAYSACCADGAHTVVVEKTGLDYGVVIGAVERYLAGDAAACVKRLGRPSLGTVQRVIAAIKGQVPRRT